jgi:hypothetical protein
MSLNPVHVLSFVERTLHDVHHEELSLIEQKDAYDMLSG